MRHTPCWLVIAACSYTTPAGSTDRDAAPTGDSRDAAIVPLDVPDAPVNEAWLPGFTYRRRIVITRGGTETLQSFPVAIARTSDPSIAQHARSDGSDLVITGDDAVTPLDLERASYTAATGA